MGARTANRLWLATALLCLLVSIGTSYVGTPTQMKYRWQKRNMIVELRELPIGQVRVRGVVTYVDHANKRFWLQDETGAIVINQDSELADVRFGDALLVEMKKTHAYDPAIGVSSLALTDFRVNRSQRNASLPTAENASIATLSEEAKTGIRVTIEGVVHDASANVNGLAQVYLGDKGHEVQAFVPGDPLHFAKWINSRVRITGVLEVLLDQGGSPSSELIWVQNAADLQTISSAPSFTPVSTIRSIYAENKRISADMVRVRGRVLYQEAPDLLVMEDEWGAIACHLQQPVEIARGSAVEARGFLTRDGLRIDLMHVTTTEINGDVQLASSPLSPVTTIAGIRALAESVIRTAPPVRVTGVITYMDPVYRQFFLQDSTAGIFLKYSGTPVSLYRGERITVTGLAGEGDFAPVIVAPKFAARGPAPLPRPIPLTMQAEFGALDSMYGEVEGVVHPARERQDPRYTTFYLYTALGPVHTDLNRDGTQGNFIDDLQDASVRVRGVVGEVFNSRKQLIGLHMSIPSTKDIEVIEAGSSSPFAEPATPISNLLKYSPHSRTDHRVVVSGAVTMLGSRFFYIQDKTGGVRIESETNGLHLEDVVDASGYAAATAYSPVLTDAVVKARGESRIIDPQPVDADAMSDGHLDSQLVSVDAKLLSVESSSGTRTLSVLSGGHTFQAILYLTDTGQPFIPPQEGSLLRLAGICSVDVARGHTRNLFSKDPVSFKLIIRSPADIHVLEGGNWWTFRHSLFVVGFLILAVLFSMGRIVVLLRRIDSKNEELRTANAKESAIRQLVSAMREVRAKKKFTSHVSLPGADELALLGTEFNHMIEELHVRDVAMAEAEAKLQQQALSDALTGLPNRRLLSDRLSQSIANAKRDGSMVAIIYIDLDGFKLVNDSFGHSFGDMLLIRVTERIASRVRKSDTLARLGGDEFAVVMNRLNDVEHADLLARSLLQVISEPYEIDGQAITIGASIGICVFPDQANDESELLQFADSAMYSAKRSGKNRIVHFTKDLGEYVRERLTIENQLRRAIDDGDITVHYQPEFPIASGYPVRFEALARWTHPTLGIVPPLKFIPIAEESGLIIPLGAYVLELACTDCVSWQLNSATPIEVAVNVSTVQFSRDSFAKEVDDILKKTGLEPKLLQLELTESVMLSGLEGAVAAIKRLQNIGVTVAIDDFGTGYSALSYIQKLPFNALKIDRTFIQDILHRSETKAMVRSLIVLAQELGMNVIVEGIETEAQLRAIQEIGANEVQGFLLGHPTADPMAHLLHPDAVKEMLKV